MNPLTPLFQFAVAAAFLAHHPIAQEPSPEPRLAPPPATVILASPAAPNGEPGGLWACGNDYKVRFDGGMTFYPYVGAALPHQSVQWRTTSARIGDYELVASGTAPTLEHRAGRCEYDFGAVVERYDVLPEGLEQSFVIKRCPSQGDLVITGEVITPLLLPARAASHEGLRLRLADGRDVVAYGAAIAIDANGTTTPMTTAVEANRIVLRLPADSVAAAAFPLVVDPVLSNVLLHTGSEVDDVDLLHEEVSSSTGGGRMWVAESRTVAANDNDVRCYRYDDSFGGSGVEVYRRIGLWDETHARLAVAPAASRVVLVHSTDTGPNRFVTVHSHDVHDFTLASNGDTVPTGSGSDWRPDIGGRRNQNGSAVLIVYQHEFVAPFAETPDSTIFATVYDASNPASPFVVAPFWIRFIIGTGFTWDQERPVVNQAAGSNNWAIAFQEHDTILPNDDWDIFIYEVDGSGGVSYAGTTEDAAIPSLHKVGPQLSGGGGRYVLTYATRAFEQLNPKPTSARGSIVRAQRLDIDHTLHTFNRPHASVALTSVATNQLRASGSGFDFVSTCHWCTGVADEANSAFHLHKLGYTANVVEAFTAPLSTNGAPAELAVGFSRSLRRFPFVFGRNHPTATTSAVLGGIMTYETVAPPTLLGFSCSSGVWSNLSTIADRQQIGAQAMPLGMSGAPQNTVALLFLSTGSLPIDGGLLGAPGCWLYPDLIAPNFLGSIACSMTGGAASTTLDLPEALAPSTLTMQWVYLLPGANALGLVATEGLSVQIGR
jgi:hypothetical protein